MQSLNQQIKLIQNIKENHAILSNGTFYFGDPPEFGASSKITYPFFGLRLISSVVNGKMHTTSFNMYFCDRVKRDEGNETEVLSDAERNALDVYSQFKYNMENAYPATISLTSQITPFTERWDDEVSGVEMNVGVEQFFDRSTCDIPDSGANAGYVTIKDQDGNTLTQLVPGATYTVTIVSAIDGGNATTVFTNTVIGN